MLSVSFKDVLAAFICVEFLVPAHTSIIGLVKFMPDCLRTDKCIPNFSFIDNF